MQQSAHTPWATRLRPNKVEPGNTFEKNSLGEAKLFRGSPLPPGQLAVQPTAQKTHVPMSYVRSAQQHHMHAVALGHSQNNISVCYKYQHGKTLESSGSLSFEPEMASSHHNERMATGSQVIGSSAHKQAEKTGSVHA